MMAQGTVKSFNLVKGYGFIKQDKDGQDVFVHLSQVRAAGLSRLRKGQRVSFEMFDNQGRVAARHLRIECRATVSLSIGPAQGMNEGDRTESSSTKRKTPSDATHDHVSVFRSVLEQSLGDAIRGRDRECSGLVGVIVEPATSDAANGANWAVKGVQFGRVDRERCSAVIASCVADLRSKFQVSEWSK